MVRHNRDAPFVDDDLDDLDADMSAYVPGWSIRSDPFNLDVDCPLPPEADLFQQFSDDLEIPTLLDDTPSYTSEDVNPHYLLDPLLSLEDTAEWGTDVFPNLRTSNEDDASVFLNEIKEEIKVEPDFPPSPPPSSAGSTSSLCNTELWPNDSAVQGEVKTSLETPPLSPPSSDNSPPGSPQIVCETISGRPVISSPTLTSNGETHVTIIPCGLKLRGKKVALAQRPAPFIKPKPISGQSELEAAKSLTVKTAAPAIQQTLTLPSASVPSSGDKRKTIVLSAKDFAAFTQKVRGSQPACTIGVLNGTKAVQPASLRLQTQKKSAPLPSTPSLVPPMPVASGQTPVPTFAQVVTPNTVPAKVPLIPCQTISSTIPTVTAIPVTPNTVRSLQSSTFPGAKGASNPIRKEMEIKALKRQQRMIKNRESACLSRKKKKEYVSSLEGRLSELEQENVQLKLENLALRERLGELENAMSWTKSPTFAAKTKKATAVLAVLLLVSLNLGSFSGVMNRNPDSLSVSNLGMDGSHGSDGPVRHHGRSLLWAPNLDVSSNNESASDYPALNSSANGSVQPICPLFINQTESIRLDSELRRWIGSDIDYPFDTSNQELNSKTLNNSASSVHQKSLKGESSDNQILRSSSHTSTTMPSVPSGINIGLKEKRGKARRKSFSNRASKNSESSSNEVELYGIRPPLYDYTAFLDSFQRRDDTFYVVSFSGDHILLPAQAHNTSSRPKMSLVLPAVPINKSMFGLNHIRMMQIDCEVTNTQMLRVREADIPAHVRPSAFQRFSNTTPEEHDSPPVNSSSPSSGSSSSNMAPARSSSSSQTFRNFSQDEQNRPASQPSYKPYFMKNGYPEKLALSPSQIHKLNTAFLQTRKVKTQSHDNSSSFLVQKKPKMDSYP